MTEKEIEFVRKYPCLYDTRNSEYKNVSEKARLWEIIGTEINEPGEIARTKWKSLRDNYMRYKKEVGGTTGQAAKKFKKWAWAKHLQFLDITLLERVRTTNVTPRTEIPPEQLPDTSPLETASTAMTSITPPTNPQPSQESLPVRSRAKKQKEKILNWIKLSSICTTKKTDYDAADNLFKSYAQTFKKLSLNNQVFVKLELAKLFADIELKDAEEKAQITYLPIYSVISSNSETQDSTTTFSEIDPQIVVDLSNVTRTTQSQSNYSTATQQQNT